MSLRPVHRGQWHGHPEDRVAEPERARVETVKRVGVRVGRGISRGEGGEEGKARLTVPLVCAMRQGPPPPEIQKVEKGWFCS